MPVVLLIIAAGGLWSLAENHRQSLALRRQISAHRHPAMQPVTLYTPEFYASLSARYNRPFLGK